MDLSEVDLRPKDIAEEAWASVPPGRRIRLARDHQYGLELTPRQYETLARMPYWMLYGPEHGAPPSWFNPEGFLLPKYRPGGPRFEEFRTRRRRYRGRRLLLQLMRERQVLRRESQKTRHAVGALLGGLVAYAVAWVLCRLWFDAEVAVLVRVPLAAVLYFGGWWGLVVLRSQLLTRAVTRLMKGLEERRDRSS